MMLAQGGCCRRNGSVQLSAAACSIAVTLLILLAPIVGSYVGVPLSVLDLSGSASLGSDNILHMIDTSSGDEGTASLSSGVVQVTGFGLPEFSSSFRLFMQGGLECTNSRFTWSFGGLSINFIPVGDHEGVNIELHHPGSEKFMCMDLGIGTDIFYGKWVDIEVQMHQEAPSSSSSEGISIEATAVKKLIFMVDGHVFFNSVLEIDESAFPVGSVVTLHSCRQDCHNSHFIQSMEIAVSDHLAQRFVGGYDWNAAKTYIETALDEQLDHKENAFLSHSVVQEGLVSQAAADSHNMHNELFPKQQQPAVMAYGKPTQSDTAVVLGTTMVSAAENVSQQGLDLPQPHSPSDNTAEQQQYNLVAPVVPSSGSEEQPYAVDKQQQVGHQYLQAGEEENLLDEAVTTLITNDDGDDQVVAFDTDGNLVVKMRQFLPIETATSYSEKTLYPQLNEQQPDEDNEKGHQVVGSFLSSDDDDGKYGSDVEGILSSSYYLMGDEAAGPSSDEGLVLVLAEPVIDSSRSSPVDLSSQVPSSSFVFVGGVSLPLSVAGAFLLLAAVALGLVIAFYRNKLCARRCEYTQLKDYPKQQEFPVPNFSHDEYINYLDL